MSDKSNNLAVLLDFVKSGFLALFVVGPLFLVLAEGLLLGVSPVFVESSSGFVGDVLGPDGFEGSEASWGLDVADDTDADHWWGFDDGDRLDDFLLVELGSLSRDFSHDVGHTSLVSNKSGQVALLTLVILRVRLEPSKMSAASLSREKSLGTVTGCFKFSMRHNNSVSST